MDLVVRQNSTSRWTLADLVGRYVCHIERDVGGVVRVVVGEQAVATSVNLLPGPYASLEAALAEIEQHIQGTCMLRYDV
jgi:hypothetical protein